METTSLQDMRYITELWVDANWRDCKCNVDMFEERVQETVKATDDPLYRMYLADSIFLLVSILLLLTFNDTDHIIWKSS